MPAKHISLKPKQLTRFIIQRSGIALGVITMACIIGIIALAYSIANPPNQPKADAIIKEHLMSIYRLFDAAPLEIRPILSEEISTLYFPVSYVTVDQPIANPLAPVLAEATISTIAFSLTQGEAIFALSDGHLIIAKHASVVTEDHQFAWNLIAALIIMLLSALCLWALTRYLSPVQKVIEAADQLSLEHELSPINETEGAELARDAARAFNRMQNRIREYLQERSLMIHALHHDLRHGLFKLQMRMEQVSSTSIRDKGLRDINEILEILEEVLAFTDTDLRGDKRQNIRINSIVYGTIDTWIDQGRTIGVNLKAPHSVYADQTRLKRIISNLVGNAMAYADQLWIHNETNDVSYQLIFDDDGPGIPEHERTRVLQPFQRLDKSRNRSSGGTGLGLAIVKRSVERDLGSVTLYDSPKGGLRVVISLPRQAGTHTGTIDNRQ